MKNLEVINLAVLVSALPTVIDGKSLDSDTKAKLIILKYHYEKANQAFEEEMQEVLKKLKPEGFDDRLRAMQEAERTLADKKAFDERKEGERPEEPSKEALDKASETLKGKADFIKELNKVDEEYSKARQTRLMEDYDGTPRTIDYPTYVKLVEFVGDSTVKLPNGNELSSVQCLGGLAAIIKE